MHLNFVLSTSKGINKFTFYLKRYSNYPGKLKKIITNVPFLYNIYILFCHLYTNRYQCPVVFFFIENNPPYVIGILPKFIEVRTIETKLLIQQIELSNAKYICQER